MVTSSGGLHDCHGNMTLAAFSHIISHVGSLQCAYSLSHDSYFMCVHTFILFYLLSISPLVRLRYCPSHVPHYLSLSLCCSSQLSLFLLAFLSVPLYAFFFLRIFSLHCSVSFYCTYFCSSSSI